MRVRVYTIIVCECRERIYTGRNSLDRSFNLPVLKCSLCMGSYTNAILSLSGLHNVTAMWQRQKRES